jgi:GntR family transcriptional regulator
MVRDRRPLPLQVRLEILALIEREGLRAGDQLPTETALAAEFDVGRTTIREALKLLEQDGVIDVRHGLGRFVSAIPTLERPITRLESVTEMMRNLGYAVANQVLSVAVGPASNEETAALDLPAGSEVIRLERVRLQGETPLIYSADVFPRALIDGSLDEIDWSGSLLDRFEAEGHRVALATAQIRAATLPSAIARRMGIPDQPWLLLVHRNLEETGRPLIYSHDYYRGDSFTFNVLRKRAD